MKIVAGTGDIPSATLLGNRERRLAWERGQADYLGSDRFENIQKKLDQKLTTTVSVPKLGEKPRGLNLQMLPLPCFRCYLKRDKTAFIIISTHD